MNFINEPLLEKMKRYLDFSARKQQVITSNLANVETPGYKAKELKFEELFQAEMGGQGPLRTSRPEHYSSAPTLVRNPVVEEIQTDAMGNDLNNVDMDKELTDLAENVLKFSVVTQLMQMKVHLLESSIREGKV